MVRGGVREGMVRGGVRKGNGKIQPLVCLYLWCASTFGVTVRQ